MFACSLDDQELAARRREWRSLERAALIESRPRTGGFTARYRGDEATARALEALVAAERVCCPDIDWRVERESDDVLRLDVTYEDERNAPISEASTLGWSSDTNP